MKRHHNSHYLSPDEIGDGVPPRDALDPTRRRYVGNVTGRNCYMCNDGVTLGRGTFCWVGVLPCVHHCVFRFRNPPKSSDKLVRRPTKLSVPSSQMSRECFGRAIRRQNWRRSWAAARARSSASLRAAIGPATPSRQSSVKSSSVTRCGTSAPARAGLWRDDRRKSAGCRGRCVRLCPGRVELASAGHIGRIARLGSITSASGIVLRGEFRRTDASSKTHAKHGGNAKAAHLTLP